MSLFQLGDFTLNSGAKSAWKLECDALTDDDIEALALMVRQIVGPFQSVEGVPRGGLRLAKALEPHWAWLGAGQSWRSRHLIVDDVLTTGGSMERAKAAHSGQGRGEILGAVIFARGPCPEWIKPVFQMPEHLWVKKDGIR